MPHHGSTHPLTGYGWDAEFADSFAVHAADGLVPGRIIRVDRGRCDLVVPDGDGVRTVLADTALVTTGDPLRIMCTGDWAAVDLAAGHVRALLPRRTAFVRSTSSKRSEGQILAANVDHAVIAVSLAVELDLGRIERFLALAWESGATPLVVLSKADLVPDPAVLAHLVADTEAAAPGAQVLAVSAETGEGVDALAAVLAGATSVLLGQSGAGKSTLANALLGTETQTVQAIRDRDGKGRHTTTTRNLLALPGGGVLIDTPGLRGVGLWDAEDGVARTFSEIDELAAECRFHDCGHASEPGCAVLAAVEAGELPERRLASYRKLLRENAHIAARTDARLRAEMRREWKVIQAAGRRMNAEKRGGRG
ncbi:ribosome small subunit-dependent GTPase A [Streptomyces cinnamoneus]|uniref:Small ribosomal subunit biogenesis GTPase RsgA n=1 Tax=Streptomyces cinnamoneus TaxID=53446 RepID=A0A2G1X9Y8_STRCJ|nr:ribosome small subunit-dependent GTPase A [Streptomyces cinnamoneus]PHQ48038.1 ribosome small subunit-dependent GTPase A [Streptomyces cinnamoneus]PPT15664.1 ribosome small subunit-dependent GTPase A [Streptomyces cinnamoneus]